MKVIRSVLILMSLLLCSFQTAQAAPVVIEIFADNAGTWNQWGSTGVTLHPGDIISIAVTGQATSASGSRPLHDANGVSSPSSPNATESLVSTANLGALVGMIDSPPGSIPTAPPFNTAGMYLLDDGVGSGFSGPGFVGTSFTQTVPQGVTGILYLGFNDGFDADNQGSYVVTIQVTPAASGAKVLVAGGMSSNSAAPATAELYDPATGTWSATANTIAYGTIPTNGICSANMTLLGNGKALIAGGGCGGDNGTTTNATSLYDPATNLWSTGASMAYGRNSFGLVTLANGDALAFGGCAGGCSGPNVLGQYAFTVAGSVERYSATGSSWATRQTLATRRAGLGGQNSKTVTLQNGKVLVCGGNDAFSTTYTSCELYDPTANTWSATAGSYPELYGPSGLVLLNNGKVLSALGYSLGAVLFDPASGTWSATGAPSSIQNSSQLVKLNDGRVLMTGGYVNNAGTYSTLATAQIYDPTAGTWSAAASMGTARFAHFAVLLEDGKVLVGGGVTGSATSSWGAPVASAEIFDPATGLWSPTGSMTQARWNNVNVVRLTAVDSTPPTITAASSTNANGSYPSGSVINITLNFSEAVSSTGLTITLNSGGSITTGVLSGASSFSGSYTVAGGQDSADLSITAITGTISDAAANASVNPAIPAGQNIADVKAIVIDTTAPQVTAFTLPPTATSTTVSIASLTATDNVAVSAYCLSEANSSSGCGWSAGIPTDYVFASAGSKTLYVFAKDAAGNISATTLSSTAATTITLASNWGTGTALPAGRYGPASAAIATTIYVAGGNNGSTDTPTLQALNSATGIWSTLAAMPGGRYGGNGAAVIDGKLYVSGGWDNSVTWLPHSELYAYDPALNSWSSKASMPTLSANGASGVINGKLYVTTAANGNSGYRNWLHVYDPALNSWSQLASTTIAHANPGYGVIGGKLYVAGGGDDAGNPSARLEVYDPSNNTWATKADLPAAGGNYASAVANGKLYLFAGTNAAGNYSSAVYVYDPFTNSWSTEGTVPTNRNMGTATYVNGVIYLVGGTNASGVVTAVETYTPTTTSPILSVATSGSGTVSALPAGASVTPHEGALVNSPTWTAGKFGNALNLSNGQYVTIPAPAPDVFNITGDLTLSLWVKPNSVTCSGADPAYALISKRSANHATPYELFIGNGGTLTLHYWGTDIQWPNFSATATLTTGDWQHVAVTRSFSGSSSTVSFYINGVPAGSTTMNTGLAQGSSDPLWISRDGYHTGFTSQGSYSGLMDDVQIYSRAVSAAEITKLYTNDYAAVANRVGNWKFDETSGSAASDSTVFSCSDSCSDVYQTGTVVSLSATPAAGSTFSGWSGDCTGTGACQVTMDSAKNVTATFVYSLVNGTCGSSDGKPFIAAPTINLCSTGTASVIPTGPGPWSWSCNGSGGGSNDSCSATQDNTPPVITFSSIPMKYSNQASGAIAFSADETATFECKFDSGSFATCTSPFSYNTLANGQHTMSIRATDVVGNIAASSYSWTVNTALAASSAILLPQTGQVKCYDAAGLELTSCDGTGQDGDVRAGVPWPNPRFTDNGTGTVTDTLTGLMWTKDANLAGSPKSWQEALDYIKQLNLSNYMNFNNWRLPNRSELMSITNYQQSDLADWLNSTSFLNVLKSSYLTSSSYIGTNVWHIHTVNGDIHEDDSKYTSSYVWPVRDDQFNVSGISPLAKTGQVNCYDSSGIQINCNNTGQDGDLVKGVNWPSPRFEINTDQTITDYLTGLVWNRSADGTGSADCSAGTAMNWVQANSYISCLNSSKYLNYDNWRLPNINELESLIDIQNNNPSLPSNHPFNFVNLSNYWSSTTLTGSPDNVLGVYMASGHMVAYANKQNDNLYVWPVRGGYIQQKLTITKSGSGTGSVGLSTGTISWATNTGTSRINPGDTVTLTAIPDSGSIFAGWAGACVGTDTCQLTMDATRNVTATFDSTLVNGTCGSANGQPFIIAPTTNLCTSGTVAVAPSGPGPWSWICNGGNGGSNASCSATVQTYTVSASVSGGNGSISCQTPVSYGSSSLCTIAPSGGYHLATLTDNGASIIANVSGATVTIASVTCNHTVVAAFTADTAPLVITNSTLPAWDANLLGYSQSVAVTGGTGVYTWAVSSGSLPPDLNLNTATGSISGTPSTAGTFLFTVQVTDNALPTPNGASRNFSITINPAPVIAISMLPLAVQGKTYNMALVSSGGTGSIAWSITAGTLPAGISINNASGVLSGTPTTVGSSTFTIRAADAVGGGASREFTLQVVAALQIVTSSLPSGTRNQDYSSTLSGSGGILPYSWQIQSGALPAGLTLNSSSGQISGTPTINSEPGFSITLADSGGQSLTVPFSILIAEAVAQYGISGSVAAGNGTVECYPLTVNSGGSSSCTVTPAPGYLLTALTDNGVNVLAALSNGSYSISTIAAAHTVSATFAPRVLVPVSKSDPNAGAITSSPGGISCPSGTCTDTFGWFAAGSQLTLNATPASGYYFQLWSGCDSGTANPCSVTVRSDLQPTAWFASQKVTTLTISPKLQTLSLNQALTISGRLDTNPSAVSSDLNNQTITLTITAPGGTSTTTTQTVDTSGNWSKQLNIFTVAGSYLIKANFAGATKLISSNSDSATVLVEKRAGYAVIIQGKNSDNEGLDDHRHTTDHVQAKLQQRGFLNDDILYLKSSASLAPTWNEVRAAVQVWARDKMLASPAPLYLVFVDHGSQGKVHLGGTTAGLYISPQDINSWLTSLENDTGTSEKRYVIIGTCYSGSFVPALSKPGRVIVTSATEVEESIRGQKIPPTNVRPGELFIEELFSQLGRGNTFKDAFGRARDAVKYKDTRQVAFGYHAGVYDRLAQHPLVDDDGNGTGSYDLDNATDGLQLALLKLGEGAVLTNSGDNPADISQVTPALFLQSYENSATLWLTANQNSRVGSVWAEIRKPGSISTSGGSGQQVIINLETVLFSYNNSSARWETAYAGFTNPGNYEIQYYTQDNVTGDISPMERSLVYRNQEGNDTPAAFNLISPSNGAVGKTFLPLVWSASSDPDGLTYTLLVSTDSNFNSFVYREENLLEPMTVIPNGPLADQTLYYWRVIAVDSFGAQRASTQTFSFTTDNSNGLPGIVSGYLLTSSGVPISGGTLNNGDVTVTSLPSGAFMMTLPPGSPEISAQAIGFTSANTSLNVTAGSVVRTVINLAPAAVTDSEAPNVTDFALSSTSYSLTVPVTSLTATDNVAVTDWCLQEADSPVGCIWNASLPTSRTFSVTGSHTLYAFARDAAGNVSSSRPSTTVITLPVLTVSIVGAGTVTSNVEAGFSCDVSICYKSFPVSTLVTLYATPASTASFTNWSGDCSGSEPCQIAMSADRAVTAHFTGYKPFRIDGINHDDLQSAYAAATNGSIIKIMTGTWSGSQSGDMTAGEVKTVTIDGGYDALFTIAGEPTIIQGGIRITAGRLTVRNVKIQ